MTTQKPKIFMAHDWLDTHGGAEQMLECFIDLFHPERVFTLVANRESKLVKRLGSKLTTSILQRIPFGFQLHRKLLSLYPRLIESFNLSDADLILSSSHCVAKGVLTRSNQLHISYVHTPMRYLWDQTFAYEDWGNLRGWKRWYARRVFHNLRNWDVQSSSRVDLFIANSAYTASRIWRCYRRPSIVIHPFVNLEHFIKPAHIEKKDYFVVLSRLVSQKRVDLAVEACRLGDIPLKVIGSGPELAALKRLAGPRTEFLGALSHSEMIETIASAQGMIFAPEEDFGIVPLESQALGTAVLAYRSGGALETVVEGKTGAFFDAQTPASLLKALREWNVERFASEDLLANAARFSRESFEQKMKKVLAAAWLEKTRSAIFQDEEFIKSLEKGEAGVHFENLSAAPNLWV